MTTPTTPTTSHPGWHPADIKAALEKRGWTFVRISRQIGHKNKCTASRVLRHPYPLVERIVADILGVEPQYIWPDRYHADGTPRGRGIRRKLTKFPTLGNSKSSAVA